jgi:FkbM family methyltransferase
MSNTLDPPMTFFAQLIGKDDLVFDIGANIGEKTILFSELADKVIAVEPLLECSTVLTSKFENTNVTVVNKAVGSFIGKDLICKPGNVSTTASMSNRFVKEVGKSGRFGDMHWYQSESVEVVTLDLLIEQFGVPDFIKIDVEGYEPNVVRGLSQPVNLLSFEFTPEVLFMVDEVFDHLDSLGWYETNYTLNHAPEQFELSGWVTPGFLQGKLIQYEGNNSLMGDIYVRFE